MRAAILACSKGILRWITHVMYEKSDMGAQMLEVSLLGEGTVLRLA